LGCLAELNFDSTHLRTRRVNAPHPPAAPNRPSDLLPGVAAAVSFGVGDVFSKAFLIDGGDVLSLSMFRSVFSVVVIFAWLRLAPPPVPHTPRQRNISLAIGVLFAGIVFGLFKAIELATVPVAILSYFVYPLFTGIAGALFGIDKLTWRGAATAAAAFFGLALIVGAQPGEVALAGIAFAVGAACCRTATMLITRALLQDADTRLITWYTMLSSTAIFVLVSLGTWHWQGPQTGYGWFALMVVSVVVTIAVLALFVSISRVGPFRTALIMNLEPLLATLLAAPLLGEVITPLQGLGGAIMLAALVAFQLRR
jgi:drug/metabolite transporter (DMT)-like permease